MNRTSRVTRRAVPPLRMRNPHHRDRTYRPMNAFRTFAMDSALVMMHYCLAR